MRSSAALFQAVLLALTTASPRPENPHIGNAVVSQAEPRSLVARAGGLSPEIAQIVADHGITSGCYSSETTPTLPVKKAKRGEGLVPRDGPDPSFCPYPDPNICVEGFSPLCCQEESVTDSQFIPVGLIESDCELSRSFQIW